MLFERDIKHDLKYLDEYSEAVFRYIGQIVFNVFEGVAINIGVKDPDKLAKRPPKRLTKGFLDGLKDIGRRIIKYVGRRKQSPHKPFKIKGRPLYRRNGKPFTNQEWKYFERQVMKYMAPYLSSVSEEMAVKGVLLAMASSEMDAQGKGVASYGKKSYEQIENEKFVGYIPDSLLGAEARLESDSEIRKAMVLSYTRTAEYVQGVDDKVRQAIKEQVITAHRLGKTSEELASDLYWMAEDKPELKKYTTEGILRDWHRVSKTELAYIHEIGKLAVHESQAKKSVENPELAIYYVFGGSGQCDWCKKMQGKIVRHIPLELVGDEGDDSLSGRDIDDPHTDIAIWQGKNNVGYSKADWRICTPVHPWPFSSDTEVLTSNGWKLFENVIKSDLIFSKDIETDLVEYVKWDKKFINRYKGKMVHFTSQYVDILVTPDHSMLIERRVRTKGKPTRKIKETVCADHLLDEKEFSIPRSGSWNGKKTNKHDILIAELLGWYVAEEYGRLSGVNIAQSATKSKKNYARIKSLLTILQIDFSESDNGFYFSGNYAKLLQSYCKGKAHEKFIHQYIKEMDVKGIETFLDAFNKGDGSKRKRKCFGYDSEEIVYYTSSPKIMTDLGELIIKCGRSFNISIIGNKKGAKKIIKGKEYTINHDVFCIRESKVVRALFVPANKSKINVVDYDGQVNCLYLKKNNTLLTKRNGKISWSGNCADTFSRIYPDSQEYDSQTRKIKQKGESEFVDADFIKERKDLEAKNIARRERQEADRMKGIHKKDSEYYEKKGAKLAGFDNVGGRIVEQNGQLYVEVSPADFNKRLDESRADDNLPIPVTNKQREFKQIFGDIK